MGSLNVQNNALQLLNVHRKPSVSNLSSASNNNRDSFSSTLDKAVTSKNDSFGKSKTSSPSLEKNKISENNTDKDNVEDTRAGASDNNEVQDGSDAPKTEKSQPESKKDDAVKNGTEEAVEDLKDLVEKLQELMNESGSSLEELEQDPSVQQFMMDMAQLFAIVFPQQQLAAAGEESSETEVLVGNVQAAGNGQDLLEALKQLAALMQDQSAIPDKNKLVQSFNEVILPKLQEAIKDPEIQALAAELAEAFKASKEDPPVNASIHVQLANSPVRPERAVQAVQSQEAVQNVDLPQEEPALPSSLHSLLANSAVRNERGNSPFSSGVSQHPKLTLIQPVVIQQVTAVQAESQNGAALEGGEGTDETEAVSVLSLAGQQEETTFAGMLQLTDTKMQSSQNMVKLPVQTVNAHNFANDIQDLMVRGIKLTNGNGISEALINLNPENLGNVQIKLTMQNGQLVAHFITENHKAKESLESQMNQLKTNLINQGVQIERMEVSQSTKDFTSGMFQEQRKDQQASQQNKSSRNKNADNFNDLGDELLVDELTESAPVRNRVFNSGNFYASV